MTEPDKTRASLLLRIRDSRDHQAWSEFAEIYSPLVYRYARRHGLQEADAAVVVQEVLRTVAERIGRFDYNPEKGTFRGWLLAVARSRIGDLRQAQGRELRGAGGTDAWKRLDQHPAADESDEIWEEEYRRSVFDWAASRVRPEFRAPTWQAFWKTRVEGRDITTVAEELGMSVGAVYVARSRVLARLKEVVGEIENE